MATKTQIKNYIKDRVYTNTRQAITGDGLQETLCKVVDDLELGSSTGGVEKNYVDSQDQMTLEEAKKYTDAKVAGGGEALLTWRYSTVASKEAPLDPDKAPDLWHAAPQTNDDHWAALKETGGSWNIWPLTVQDGTDGRGIKSSLVEYALSDQGNNPPSSGWSTTSPDIVEGKYLWSRTTTTYTDNTTSVVYTVTYIGKDGNDGKNGSSVNIKGSLESIDDLPTDPKPSENDGYIIGEDLWVYTGTELENDKNHNGFTNVGKVSVKGDSACLHIAWANTLAPDYENFTTQKPKGQRYRYMGTYVDYSENPSQHPDSQNPEDYNWQEVIGEQGESVIVADLDNEIQSVALTYDGKTTAAASYSPVATMWYGTHQLTLDSLTAVVTKTEFANNVIVVPNKDTGVISVSWAKDVELTSFNVDITVKATVNDVQYVKLLYFKVNCVKAGAPGEDAVYYEIEPSTTSIHKYSDGSISDLTVSCKKIKVVGKSRAETTDGVLYYKIDTNNRVVYTGAIDTSLISRKIRFEFEVNNVLWDAEDIFIIEDSTAPKIVDTKYSFAITMNHTIPSDDSWTEPAHLDEASPIEGLPGQYLWTKIIYTWSDGTVTYSISYARCGTNGADGKDGKSKPSVIQYKGTWTTDGLYTGTETDNSIIVDIVYYVSAGAVDGKYYMAIQTKKFVNESTPAPDTDAGKAYWGAFQGQYANIATGLLFAERTVIENATIRELRTSDSGEKIETIGNKMIITNERDKIVAEINPSKDLSTDSSIELSKKWNRSYQSTILSLSGTYSSNTSAISNDTTITDLSYTTEFDSSPYDIYAYVKNLAFYVSDSSSGAANVTGLVVNITVFAQNVSTKEEITLAKKRIAFNDLTSVNGTYYPDSIRAIATDGTKSFFFKIRASYTLSTVNNQSVSLSFRISTISGLEVGFATNRGVLIGNSGLSVGSEPLGKYVNINAFGENLLEVESDTCGIKVGDDLLIKTKNGEYSLLNNPVAIQYTATRVSIGYDSDVVNRLMDLSRDGTPIYIDAFVSTLLPSVRVLLGSIDNGYWYGTSVIQTSNKSYLVTVGFSGSMSGGKFSSDPTISAQYEEMIYESDITALRTQMQNQIDALSKRIDVLEGYHNNY